MGITGGITMMILYENIDTKGKWNESDRIGFIVFGLTTALIPFIH